MLSAALMLLLREERQRVKFALGLVSTVLGLGVAVLLMLWTDQAGAPVNLGVYMPGNWPMPFGISLALDRLTGMMLVLTYTVALASLIFSSARWHRAGMHFHSLFQFQLMGLSGAFLTADLFNLFVFFEIDRKSTRLNSSHSQISYAVFCLKKKKTSITIQNTVSS